MVQIISIFNIVSLLALLLGIGLVIAKIIKKSNKSLLVLLFAILLLAISEFTNVLEYLDYAPEADEWEDLIQTLFLPLLILSLHIGLLKQELNKRLVSENKFKAIFNHAYTFIGLLDEKGHLLEANDAAFRAVRSERETIIGQPLWETPWWKHSSTEQTKIQHAIGRAKKGEVCRFHTTHHDENSQLVYIDQSLTPVFDQLGTVIYMIAEGRNVTQLNETLRELKQHKNELEQLVKEKTKELNSSLKISEKLNKELYTSNEKLKKGNRELKEQSDYLQHTLNQLKDAQHQLIESEKMASLGILTAGVAHEINNPLNFIMGGVTGIDLYASENLAAYDEEIKKPIKTIYSGIKRISQIVKSLRTYSRTDDYQKSSCNINSILDDCLVILQNKWKDRIVIIKNYHSGAVIEANAGRIHQAFLNLLNNAIQAIENTGNITITTAIGSGQAILKITDDGIGIAPKYLKKIFDPFFTTKEPNEGTGLGLSITQKIISDYRGTLKYLSTEHKGTTVEVIFYRLDTSEHL